MMTVPVFVQEKSRVRDRIEKAVCLTLAGAILFFSFSPRRSRQDASGQRPRQIAVHVMDLPPLTEFSSKTAPPLLPQVPVLSEDETISPDITIDMTDLEVNIDVTPPRYAVDYDPDAEYVIKAPSRAKPEPVNEKGYVKLALLVNQQGWVDSVVVVENTTRSHNFELESVKKAYRSRYLTRQSSGAAQQWIERTFRIKDTL